MQKPLQITFRDMEPSAALEARIRAKAAKLDSFDDRIMGCRVVVERLSARHRSGNDFGVRIEVTLPGRNVTVDEARHEDAYVAVRDAFDAAARMLTGGAPTPQRGRQPEVEA